MRRADGRRWCTAARGYARVQLRTETDSMKIEEEEPDGGRDGYDRVQPIDAGRDDWPRSA